MSQFREFAFLVSGMFGFRKKKKDSGGGEGDAWLFIGLGNPGAQYARNRHNIGFMAVDSIAGDHGFPAPKSKHKGLLSEGKIDGVKVIILKPQTFMNLSGESAGPVAKFYKIPPERIVVFYDEIELPAAKLRVKQGGGNAGHNGLKSLDLHLPSVEYKRVRMGVGRPGHGNVSGHVLGDFGRSDEDWLNPLFEAISRNAGLLLAGSDAGFMNKITIATRATQDATAEGK
jgi:peptidyl-tRNA hydrolase, PTH1 family